MRDYWYWFWRFQLIVLPLDMTALYKCLMSCRLFQPSTGTSPKKFCQLINSPSLSTFLPWLILIGHGQVGWICIGVSYPLYSFVLSSNRHCFHLVFAAVYFLYDLSPITVTIKEERRSFLHFITRLCAVLGGTFALTGIIILSPQKNFHYAHAWNQASNWDINFRMELTG